MRACWSLDHLQHEALKTIFQIQLLLVLSVVSLDFVEENHFNSLHAIVKDIWPVLEHIKFLELSTLTPRRIAIIHEIVLDALCHNMIYSGTRRFVLRPAFVFFRFQSAVFVDSHISTSKL